ncbi:MAG: VOC family protein [Chloroflexi bacterium]|nr:VOC family protein [Chloroflexota bacterium]
MFKKIDHVELITGNIERTIDFYTKIMGFKVKERRKTSASPGASRMREIVYIELNGSVIELMSVENPAPPSKEPWQIGYPRIALEVDDMDETVAYLKEKGVKISREPVNLGTSKRGEIEDPDGLSIELRQWG